MRYLINGWLGHDNLGDDLLLLATVEGLVRRDPMASCYVLTENVNSTMSLFSKELRKHVKAYRRRTGRLGWRWQMWQLARGADYYLVAGGTALRDFSFAPDTVTTQYKMARLACFAGCKLQFMGLGVGPLWRDCSRLTIRNLFSFSGVTVRDEQSYKQLLSCGVKDVKLAADLVFSLDRLAGEKRSPREVKRIGLALRNWDTAFNRESDCELLKAGELITKLKTVFPNAALIFYCFQSQGDGVSNDYEFIKKVLDSDGLEAEIVSCTAEHSGGVSQVVNEFRKLDLLVGMRLHALILGAMQGVPLVAIEYDPKVRALMKSLGCEQFCFAWNAWLDNDAEGIFSDAIKVEYSVSRLREMSERNFEFLSGA